MKNGKFLCMQYKMQEWFSWTLVGKEIQWKEGWVLDSEYLIHISDAACFIQQVEMVGKDKINWLRKFKIMQIMIDTHPICCFRCKTWD